MKKFILVCAGIFALICGALNIVGVFADDEPFVEETESGVLTRTGFREGDFVTYRMSGLLSISKEDAQVQLKAVMDELHERWEEKLDRYEVEFFLGENYLPYGKGMWVGPKSVLPVRGTIINFDEDGRHQSEAQSLILGSEKMRMKIFYEIVDSEDRAHEEAYELYPTDMVEPEEQQEALKNKVKKSAEFVHKYREEILNKYGLTEKQLSGVAAEGVRRNWPLP
ncbi:MAG: hypothetical protein ABIJ27_00925 [Candidatus Omnitrophota bacterium]